MSVIAVTPARRPPGRAWLRWGLCFVVVVVMHAGLLLLFRSTPTVTPAVPNAILMDLAPAPDVPLEPIPPPLPQLQPPSPPDSTPVFQPPPLPVPTPRPVEQAEVPLPPPLPPRPKIRRLPPAKPAEINQMPTQEQRPPPASTAPPRAAAPPSSGQPQTTWESRLVTHLARFKRFPSAAQRRGEQGVVLMRLTIGRSGDLLAMVIVRGSGYADLDGEAQDWVARARPLPPFTSEMTMQRIEVVVPLRFILE